MQSCLHLYHSASAVWTQSQILYTQWSYINETFLETSSYRPNNNKKQTKGMDMVKVLEGSENLKKQNKAGSHRHLYCWLPSTGLWSKQTGHLKDQMDLSAKKKLTLTYLYPILYYTWRMSFEMQYINMPSFKLMHVLKSFSFNSQKIIFFVSLI